MLGQFIGTVVKGKQIGRTIGFPTANLETQAPLELERGVYAVLALAQGMEYPAIMNIGVHPTLPEGAPTIEVHLIGYSGDLYGETLEIRLVCFLRCEQTFTSVDALVCQLERDREEALRIIRASGSK